MTVGELLERISSYELTEWQAYEVAFGPLDNSYEREALAGIQEQLQNVAYVTGMTWGGDMPEPEAYPRAFQQYEEHIGEDEDDPLPRRKPATPEAATFGDDRDALSAYFDLVEGKTE